MLALLHYYCNDVTPQECNLFFNRPCNKFFHWFISDDWNAVAPSVHQLMSSSLQAPVQEPVIRVYLSAPNGMRKDVELFKQV